MFSLRSQHLKLPGVDPQILHELLEVRDAQADVARVRVAEEQRGRLLRLLRIAHRQEPAVDPQAVHGLKEDLELTEQRNGTGPSPNHNNT